MKRAIIALALIALPLGAQVVSHETTGGQRIVGDVYKSTGPTNTFYGGSGAPSTDNSTYFLYIQGDEARGDSSPDKVILYTTPYTWSGLTNHFNYDRTLLPDSTHPAGWFYGHPSVNKDGGAFYLTAHQSITDFDFDQINWGVSTNGRDFQWRTLLRYSGHDDEYEHTNNDSYVTWGRILAIPGVTLRGPVTIAGQQFYWGFMEVHIRPPADACTDGAGCSGGDGLPDDPYWRTHPAPARHSGLGAILVRKSTTTGYGYSDVYVWASNGSTDVWRIVNADGTFDFLPTIISNAAGQSPFTQPQLQWLNNRWEVGVNYSSLSQCGPGLGTSGLTVGGNRLLYFVVNPPANLSSPPTIGTSYDITSQIRCMPGDYPNSRLYPWRVEGTNLLYSSSNDQYKPSDGSYWGMQIVVTGLTPP